MKKLTVIILLIALIFTFSACSLLDGTGGTGGTGGNGGTGEGGTGNQEGDEPEHVHSFSSAWESDDKYHWHAATCGHTDEISGKKAHTWINGICTVCKAEASGVEHKHTFAEGWTSDDNYHWHPATCQHTSEVSGKAKHTYVDGRCKVCQALDPNQSSYPYEFGDEVSINNKNFYKDYTEAEKQLYYMLWSESTTVSIKVDITPYELSKINEAVDDYNKGNTLKADTYRKCNLTIVVNGKEYHYDEVGIRMRGNTSRAKFLDDNGYIKYFVHFRFSLSETFDGEEYEGNAWGKEIYHDWSNDPNGRAARKDRSFATMEKFYYKWNKNYDQTYIREVYANRMFQAYGILTPHITLTQFEMQQTDKTDMLNMGVGNLYETVDKAFIKRNLGKDRKGGDLYKCGYGSGFGADFTEAKGYGVETPTQRFTYSLKTNDDRTAPDYNHNDYLKAFIEMLKTDKNAFKTKLEAMVDMDYFTRFEAVNYLLGNPDCIRNNKNNFYIYFVPVEGTDKSTSKAYIIPYDYDRCLGANMDWNPQKSMVNAKPYDAKKQEDKDGVNSCWAGDCTNPLYTKTILDGGRSDYKAMYKEKLQLVLGGEWFTFANYQKLYNAYAAHYSSVAMPSQLIKDKCVNSKGNSTLKFNQFTFSLTEGSNIGSWEQNLSVSLYFSQKSATAKANW